MAGATSSPVRSPPNNARFALSDRWPDGRRVQSSPRPFYSFITRLSVQETSSLLFCSVVAPSVCMFAHACFVAHPFLAFNAPPTPTRRRRYNRCRITPRNKGLSRRPAGLQVNAKSSHFNFATISSVRPITQVATYPLRARPRCRV